MESSHPMNDAYFNVVDEKDMPNRICKLGHESGECSSNLNTEGDQVSCLSWSNASMTCTCTAALNNSILCNPPTAPLACVTVQDAVVRGVQERAAKTKFTKGLRMCMCGRRPLPFSTEMVHTTLNIVSEFKGVAADLVTGRGAGAKPQSQAQSTNAHCPMSQRPLDQVNILDMTQTNCKANTQTFAQSSCAARNTPATIAPIALITTPPRIHIPSSTVTIDVILCEEAKPYSIQPRSVCVLQDYSHMIPLGSSKADLSDAPSSGGIQKCIHHAPDIKSRLPVHSSLGNLLQSMGDYTGALQEYKEAAKLGEELNDLISLGWAHGNMGNAHLGLHQKDAALHHLKKALALTIEHESTPQAMSRAYNNLGTSLREHEDFKGAEENFNLASGSSHIWK
eukprot:Em0241g5a